MRIDYLLGLALLGQTLITAYGGVVRKKRDMVAIGNFIRSLFGLGCQEPTTRFIVNRPSYIPNYEFNNIYESPYENQIYVRNIPAYAISDLRNTVSRNMISPGYLINGPKQFYRPEISPFEYNPIPPVYQFNRQEPLYNLEKYDTQKKEKPSVITYSDKPPTISEDKQPHKDQDSDKIVRDKEILPQPPMYILNRPQNFIQENPIKIPIMPARIEQPVVTERNVIKRPNFGPVHIYKYPIDRVLPRKPVRIYTNEKPVEIVPTSPMVNENMELIAVPNKAIIDEDKENKMYTIPETLQKIVKFTEPVRSRFVYKSIYHNQPHKNSVITFDNTLGSSKDKADKDKVSSTNRTPIKDIDSNVSLSPNYLFIPPFSTEEPSYVPLISREENQENADPVNDMDQSDQIQESVSDDKKLTPEESYASKVLDFIRNNYAKEGQRGDIPEVSHQ